MEPTIRLNQNYQSALKSSRPTLIKTTQIGKYGAQEVPVIIPPLNTNITFAGALPDFHIKPSAVYKFTAPAVLPETWNWKDIFPGDTDDIKAKKQIITRPSNQARCGSCWVVGFVFFSLGIC